MSALERVVDRLVERDLRLAVAESCTGGLLAARLTERSGASRFMSGGLVTYSNEAKTRVLGVRTETLAAYGAVSREVAAEMATGAREAVGADASMSVTGIAGPEGGTPDKPVGTVWIAATVEDSELVELFRFDGDRAAVREQSVDAALALLERLLDQEA